MSLFQPQPISTPLRLAQVLGITSAAFLCGKTLTQSATNTPSLLLAPASLLARQWNVMFEREMLYGPVVALFGGTVFAFSAAKTSHSVLYTMASGLLFATIPYSFVMLHPTAEELRSLARKYAASSTRSETVETDAQQERTVHWLVDQWALRNLGRTVLSGVAALLATWAAVERWGVQELRVGGGGVSVVRF